MNLIGTFTVLRHAAERMARTSPTGRAQRGVIVNTASNAAFDGQIGQAAYSASKAGVAGMTLPVARDLASAGIRVVTIAPGPSDTPMLGPMRDDIRESLVSQIPFPKRLGPRRGLRRARAAHRRERLPERRGHPARRRPPHGPSLTRSTEEEHGSVHRAPSRTASSPS